jgi:hypothetical protein
MSDVQQSWLAGFIDGEGYIGLTKQIKRESRKQAPGYYYHPLLIVTGTEKDTITHLQSLTGCGQVVTQPRPQQGHKTAYQWKLSKYNDLLNIFMQIKKYLKIKQKQCDLVTQFITARQQATIKTGKGSRGMTSVSTTEDDVYEQLRKLNKKGT